MFSNISWTTFLSTSGIIIFCYYAVIASLFYKNEILSTWKEKRVKPAIVQQTVTQSNRKPELDIIGATDNMDKAESYFKQFQPVAKPIINEQPAVELNDSLKELFTEVKQGVKLLISQIAEGENSLDELKSLFPGFLEQYPTLASSKYRSKINDYILELCHSSFSFGITEDEINDLW
jgi:hypothetical protein